MKVCCCDSDLDASVVDNYLFFLSVVAGQNMVWYVESKGMSDESLYNLGIETKSGSADFCTKVDVEN